MSFPRITIRGDQMGGVPCIRGLRIPVSAVLDMVADGMTAEEILGLYPDLQREDIPEAVRFVADVVRELDRHVDVSGKRPVINGTDIKVSQIAGEAEHLGMTPDEIVEAHPHLSLADVHAALAYYYDHQDAIREEWRETRALIAELRPKYPSRLGR
jgi:uncharacterized protein (DUF433 family)